MRALPISPLWRLASFELVDMCEVMRACTVQVTN